MTQKEILIAAKEVIKTPRKWGKGSNYSEETGRHCAVGAVNRAANGGPRTPQGTNEVVRLLASCVREHRGKPSVGTMATSTAVGVVQTFNDKPGTTHKDIMAVFDCAIDKAS